MVVVAINDNYDGVRCNGDDDDGAKFVRMRPGSVLKSLYPLSRHGPDRCLICGQSFRHHLTSWWFSRLYTSYDLYLDKVRREGSFNSPHACDGKVDGDGDGGKARATYGSGCKRVSSKGAIVEPGMTSLTNNGRYGSVSSGSGVLAFHRLYTKSLTSLKPPSLDNYGTPSEKKVTEKLRKKKKKGQGLSDGNRKEHCPLSENDEMRNSGGMQYSVPKMRTNSVGRFRLSMLTIVRELVLLDLDSFVFMQNLENESNEWKKRFN